MKFLITTEPDDTHALLVTLALQSMNHQVDLLFTADSPTRQKNSVFLDNVQCHWKSSNDYFTIFDSHDVVWWRRPRKPFLPKTHLHPDDWQFLVRENRCFFESLSSLIAPDAFWVNPKVVAERAHHKLFQLEVAKRSGFNIPTTLCSNHPDDIRYFLLKNKKNGVIYKPLSPQFWFEEESVKMPYTSRVQINKLPSNQLLQLAPGIFQKEIKKQHELRVTCFGDYLFAIKLNSQDHEESLLDWRAAPEGLLDVEPFQLSSELSEKIRTFMNQMGLVFGALDFIVTENDDIIFLEVNEQGQFLWIEEYHSECHMLDIFIQFLLSRSKKFTWDPEAYRHSIEAYRSQMEKYLLENLERHIELNSEEAYKEAHHDMVV